MKLNEYQEMSKRTLNLESGQVQQLCNYSLGLTGEAGEVADHIKKGIFHGHEMNRHEIAKELGDTMFYVAALATTLGFSLEQIATMNITKLMKRFPNGFSIEDSKKRVDTIER